MAKHLERNHDIIVKKCQGMLTIKVSEAEGRLKLTTKKEKESEGGEGYIHVAKGRVGQITLVFP
jgi:hypothetical protein